MSDAPPLRLLVVRSADELAPHAAAWNRLVLAVPGALPMQGYPWVASYLEHRLEPGEEWLCVLAFEEERVVGVAPFVVSPRRLLGLRYRVLRTPRDEHTLGVDLLVEPELQSLLVPVLLRAASAEKPDSLYFELGRVVETAASLVEARRTPWRLPHTVRNRRVGAFLPIRKTFEEYRSSLSRNFRNNLNKANNKLRRLPGVAVEFCRAREDLPDDAASLATLERFLEVEASSWKGHEGSAIRCSGALTAFYTSLTRRLREAGWLEWHFLEGAGETLAANLAVRLGHSLIVWKLGYADHYARYSPGSLLFERLVQRSFESGEISEINLCTDHSWYSNWQMEWRRYCDLRIYPWRWRSVLIGLLPDAARTGLRRVPGIRRLLRGVRRRPGAAAPGDR